MHNSDPHSKNHHNHHHLVSPRISFSNDFAESQYVAKQERQAPATAASSDFEFSISSNSMMSADELFCQGKLLPFKEKAKAKSSSTTTTLREELLTGEEGSGGAGTSFRPPKGSGRWRGFLGLRKSHIGSKKADKSCEASCDSKRTAGFGPVPDNMHYHGKTSQEMMRQGGSNSCRDEEMEM